MKAFSLFFRINKRNTFYLMMIFLFFCIDVGAGMVYAATQQSYRVNAGTTTKVDEWGVCRNVINGSSTDYFVPTNTAAEWTAFQNYLPANVTLGTCTQPFISAIGGTVTYDGDYKIHTFTTSGDFAVTQVGSSPLNQVEYLVIAGGGGGGTGGWPGGGGAGGYRTGSGFVIALQTYSITIGTGGAANNNGLDSVFSTITAAGGGSGGGGSENGHAGGSGGGAGTNGTDGNGGSALGGQGYVGGRSSYDDDREEGYGGGGGGAGHAGYDGRNNTGNGGDGLANSITGSSVYYAGGGHGANSGSIHGQGAIGGGGNAGSNAGANGIVIIRYQYQ